jgi:acyl carrier protein
VLVDVAGMSWCGRNQQLVMIARATATEGDAKATRLRSGSIGQTDFAVQLRANGRQNRDVAFHYKASHGFGSRVRGSHGLDGRSRSPSRITHSPPVKVNQMSTRLERLNQVFQHVFNYNELIINRQTSAKDVEGWDSLMHVTLIVNVEKAFNVKFSSSEVASLKDVGDLIDVIDARSPAA